MTAVDGMDDHVLEMVLAFTKAEAKLRTYASNNFPLGTVVYVDCEGRYKGYGITGRQDGCKASELPVILGNGNMWCYPLEKISVGTTRPGDWPNWIKERKKIK